ncbi:MAG: hypothetical protein C4309_10415 [Chloroflexota bacterium]
MDDIDNILAPVYRAFPGLEDLQPRPNDALFKACQRPGEPEQVTLARYRLCGAMSRVTRETYEIVNAAIAAWLRRFPKDFTIISVAEMVAMRCQWQPDLTSEMQ